jgi:hypothetical protein
MKRKKERIKENCRVKDEQMERCIHTTSWELPPSLARTKTGLRRKEEEEAFPFL